MRESQIEAKVVRDAFKKLGVDSIKLNGRGRVGWPDRAFLIPRGKPLFIEFKTARGRVSPSQELKIEELKNLGYDVEVCRNYDSAMSHIRARLL